MLLPVSGPQEPAPEPPEPLGPAGLSWWTWAWSTPSACAWSAGDLHFIARRAQLEDEERSPAVLRLMIEGDDRLGLSPKARARLGWQIVDDPPPEPTKTPRRRPTL